MIIYLAHPADPSGHQAVSQAVKDRGLSLFRAKPSDVRISVVPDVAQPGYASYVNNLPAFMEATVTRKTVDIRNRGYPITTVAPMIPMGIPPLIYDFNAKPKEAKIAQLREHSIVTQGRGKNVSFVMQTPTLSLIRDVASQGANQGTPNVFGTVNLTSMKCVFSLQKIFSAFLLTHNYPALHHVSDMSPVEMPIASSIKRRKTGQSTYLLCVTDPNEHLEEPKPSGTEEQKDDSTMTDAFDSTTMVKLVRAKPSTIEDARWGRLDDMPNTSGFYVPYVAELAVGDTLTVPSLVSKYFLRSLASTTPGMIAKIDEIRSGWGQVADTRLGHEWSHLAKCIEIALQAQCYVFPVYTNDIYEGTIVCGAGYSIGYRDRVMRPVPYDKLQESVIEGSKHAVSLAKILNIIGKDKETDLVTCDSMRALAMYFKTLDIDEVNKQALVKHAMHLNFPNKYWSTSAANVAQALEYIVDSDKDIPTELPMYPKYLFSTDRDEEVLSAFGHMAPTFMIPNGRKCSMVDMSAPPKNLTIRTVTVETAVLDMKYVRENGYITNNMTNLSSKHRDIPIKSEIKKSTWDALRNLVGQSSNNDGSTEEVTHVAMGDKAGETIDGNLW